MTVNDILSNTEDTQKIGITRKIGYSMKDYIFFDKAELLPYKYYKQHVVKFYSDYFPITGSFIGIVIS